MTQRLSVSVIIPSYNAARYLGDALASVAEQSRPADEVIVVDDGSSDDTPSLLRNWPQVRAIAQANAGPAAARNTGVAHARGDLIAFLDADCLWYPEKLARQLALHEADPGLAYSFCAVEDRIEPGFDPPWWSVARIPGTGGRYRMHTIGLMIRRSTLLALGGFNPTLRTGEDTDLFARLRGTGEREGQIDEILGATRLHGANLSSDRARVGQDLPRALHAALRARRAHASASSVSALMCVRDGEAYLEEALASILAQSQPAAEIIVVDDGSSDSSAAIVGRYAPQVTLISTPPLGIGAARQRALDASRGALIAFLDADDRWSPDYLAHHRARLAADPRLDASRAQVQPFLSPEVQAGAVTPAAESLATRPGMLVAAMVIRREAVLRVGAFDTSSVFADQDWLMRAGDAGLRFADTPEALLHRRIHTRNYTLTSAGGFHGRLAALKRGLDRRRATDPSDAHREDPE